MKKVIAIAVAVIVAIHLGGIAVDAATASAATVGVNITDVVSGLVSKLWWLIAAPVVSGIFAKSA